MDNEFLNSFKLVDRKKLMCRKRGVLDPTEKYFKDYIQFCFYKIIIFSSVEIFSIEKVLN